MSDRISEHVSLKEGIKSHTATRLNIDNVPRDLDLINMTTIAEKVFEPLREWVGGYKTNAEMFEYIKCNLDFDQMIWEFGDDNNPDWIHVSYISEDANRRRILKAYKANGKTNYKII